MSVLRLQNLEPRTTQAGALGLSLTSSHTDCCKSKEIQ
ncbi:MAG TPA: class III lanthipeptide [Natronosporangium sp.]|nr:class III lanthipeptide [Natronosporangium sp.]